MRATRLEAFSDGVIAIIITIMVLELHAPHEATLDALKPVVPTFFSYLLSFIMVAIYWVNHHHLIHLAQQVDGRILWANINLLFWMSLFPWVTAFLGQTHASALSVALFAVVSAAAAAAFYFLRSSISCHHRGDEKLHDLHCHMGRKNLIGLGFYLSAVPISWVYVPLALVLIVTPAVMYFLPDKEIERLKSDV